MAWGACPWDAPVRQHLVGSLAIGAGGAVGPSYWVVVGLYTGAELWEDCPDGARPHLFSLLLLNGGGGRWLPDHGLNEMRWRVRWRWCGPFGGPRGGGQQRERRLGRKGVEVDLQWGQIPELWEPNQELSYLEIASWDVKGSWRGGPPCGGWSGNLGRWGHRPGLGVAVRLEPWAVAGSDMGESASVWPGQQLFGWVNWRGCGHEHFVGCLRPDDPLYHPAS